MADFVAVIRRAVDGLTDNTPEMRVKVYDRARGAVQRQLESMKPRPPEEMLRRQLDKLEAAIVEVEAEHAEALPAAEEAAVEHGATVQEPAPETHAAEEAHAEPHVEEPEPAAAEEVHAHEEPSAPQPVYEEPAYEEPAAHAEPEPVHEPEPAEHWQAPYEEEKHAAAQHPPEVYEEPALEPVYHEEPQVHHEEVQPHVEAAPVAPEPVHAAPAARTEKVPVDDVISQVDQIWAEVDAPTRHTAPEPQAPYVDEPTMPAAAFTEAPFGKPVEPFEPAKVSPAPAPNKGFVWDADVFEEMQPVPAAPQSTQLAQPAARQMPDNAFEDVDLFADVHSPRKTAPDGDTGNDGWRELKELAGFDKRADDVRGGSSINPDLDQAMAAKLQGKSFRMEPKRRRVNVTGIIVALVVLAILAGGGYAAWLNRDALNNMVAKLVSSAPKSATTPPASETAKTNTANNNAVAPNQPSTAAPQGNTAAVTPPGAGNTDVAAVNSDPNTVNTKFTQRLHADGTEEDEGPAPTGQPNVAEGKSIAEQNVASATPPASAANSPATAAPQTNNAAAPQAQPQAQAQAPAATAPATTDQQQPPATNQPQAAANQPPPVTQQTAPVTDGQKVFLYEERLGQTSPAAFQGTVSWSLQEGKGADGRPEPSVQGLINVPERGLTATITVSRNSDSSLPASHLIELAFQVPPNFEGGAIDNVQRVALKATEQDRGDALIAVPAKVTDDVYMVALNDFPDARKTNLDLLKNRNWIDIPVVYRNGRRALLTMEKGPTGTDAFNKAISEWQALGGVASSGQ
ncbi:hypothetical protein HGP17_09005 [Rhizobium sp. P38BS-XIX]|uniref:hypothetical protein n=1 Tax=Rhizobium sp. P38BS-XIX TaxID=2726740 RepID=UPI00145675E8|nr:hypothetical protein [Rhizobium sp. P38BS-XIX]NLR96975.1 hypothetical protein [Rhizobium sp. P38BS-XIX]